MKLIKIQPLTREAFAPFGTFTSTLNPTGGYLSGPTHKFYRDNSKFYSNSSLPVGFSPITVEKSPMIIKAAEYHDQTCEAIMPINDDAVLHVSPATGGTPDFDATKVFLVPKGTIVTLFPGVWHLCPLPAAQPQLNALIVLPERTYVNDITYVEFEEKDFFEIKL